MSLLWLQSYDSGFEVMTGCDVIIVWDVITLDVMSLLWLQSNDWLWFYYSCHYTMALGMVLWPQWPQCYDWLWCWNSVMANNPLPPSRVIQSGRTEPSFDEALFLLMLICSSDTCRTCRLVDEWQDISLLESPAFPSHSLSAFLANEFILLLSWGSWVFIQLCSICTNAPCSIRAIWPLVPQSHARQCHFTISQLNSSLHCSMTPLSSPLYIPFSF